MICNKCGTVVKEGSFCGNCGSIVGVAPSGGLATFRITARKHLPIWMMVVQPLMFFGGYKVYISVDDQNYTLKSKKQQLDIPVVPGVHNVRISSVSKRQAKALEGIGEAVQIGGLAGGNGSTYVIGNILEDVGAALSEDGVNVQFEPGGFMELKVKMNFMGGIEEDKK